MHERIVWQGYGNSLQGSSKEFDKLAKFNLRGRYLTESSLFAGKNLGTHTSIIFCRPRKIPKNQPTNKFQLVNFTNGIWIWIYLLVVIFAVEGTFLFALLAGDRRAVFPLGVVTSLALVAEKSGDYIAIFAGGRFPKLLDVMLTLRAYRAGATFTVIINNNHSTVETPWGEHRSFYQLYNVMFLYHNFAAQSSIYKHIYVYNRCTLCTRKFEILEHSILQLLHTRVGRTWRQKTVDAQRLWSLNFWIEYFFRFIMF